MAKMADQVTGIDISPGILAEAALNCEARGVANVKFAEGYLLAERADWVNSFLVFQHIMPERGFPLLRQLLDRLRPGGVASIHLTTYRTNDHLQPSLEDVRYSRFDGRLLKVLDAPSTMSAWPDARCMVRYDACAADLRRRGAWRLVLLEHFDHAGHHAFRVYGRKDHSGTRTLPRWRPPALDRDAANLKREAPRVEIADLLGESQVVGGDRECGRPHASASIDNRVSLGPIISRPPRAPFQRKSWLFSRPASEIVHYQFALFLGRSVCGR